MSGDHLKKWEIALICAVGVALLWSDILGSTPCCAWWGAVYPELAPDAVSAQTALVTDAGVTLRFQLLEWLETLLCTLGVK